MTELKRRFEYAWDNPKPLSEGRMYSLISIMKAIIEGREFSDESKLLINEAWKNVRSDQMRLVEFSDLVEMLEIKNESK